jgi:23S rRNA pseudouridine1911/1915/1917 synthase
VRYVLPEAKPVELVAEDIPLDILYEDEDLCVVNKPRGMVVHPAVGNESGTLVNALLYHFDGLSTIGGEVRPGIVHRIDKMTSGLLVVAKNDMAHEGLARQFADHFAHRSYIALVAGNIREDTGTVDAPIGRHPTERKRMAVVPNGRRAVTHFRVLYRFSSVTLLSLELETGRTHQIRVHMAHIHHPLVGDSVYSSGKNDLGMEGQALHGWRLQFTHPKTGEHMAFQAPLPEDMQRALKRLGYPGSLSYPGEEAQ